MAKRNGKPELRSAQRKIFPDRKLKVRKGYYPHRHNLHPSYKTHPSVPWVQIKGYWLNEAGFTIGSQLQVTIEQGLLILRVQSSSD